jgi:hippurate hydrolase
MLLGGIDGIAENSARAAGLPEELLPEVTRSTESTPVMINDAALAERLNAVLLEHFGPEQFAKQPRTGMGAEDFPFFTNVDPPVPGLYFQVGGTPQAAWDAAQDGGPPIPSHHSPFFRIDPEPAITVGTEAMVVAVMELLAP